MRQRLRHGADLQRGQLHRLTSSAVALALALAPLAQAAAKGERRVAALPLQVAGEMPEHARANLESKVLAELKRADAEVIGPASLPETAQGCLDSACAREVGEAASANYVLRSTVTVDGADYQVELIVLSGTTGDVVASVGDTCDTCGLAEVASTVTDLATSVRRKLDAQATEPPKVVVNSQPAGATVTLDGEVLGVTPFDVEVPAGEHDLEITLDGHVKQRQRVMFVDGVHESLSFSLQPTPSAASEGPVDTDDSAGRGMRIAGFTALGLGVASVGAGVGFLVSNGQEDTSICSGTDVDADGDCRYTWDTTPGTIAFMAAGGALIITGAILVGLGYAKHNKARKSARLEPAPTGVRLRF